MSDFDFTKFQELIDSVKGEKFFQTFRLESIDKNSSVLKTIIDPPIRLNKNLHYKVGLRYLSFFNQIVNIDATNNVFKYSSNGGSTWKTITLNPGSWEITELDNELKRVMKINNDYDKTNNTFYINLIPKPSINKIVINITKANYQLDRNTANTITTYLGFNNNPIPLKTGYTIADNIMEIIDIYTVDVYCNLSDGSYINGKTGKGIIFDIPSMTVPIGYKIIEFPSKINYFPLNKYYINEIVCELKDQDGNLLNIPSERKFISLKIEQV